MHKRKLQSLAGHLRRIFGLISQFRRRNHMIRLKMAFCADLEWWHVFVSSWNEVSLLKRVRSHKVMVHIWSDASGTWGCGALWDSQWFQIAWDSVCQFAAAAIAPKELLPIIVAVAIWGHSWVRVTVVCHCDSTSVVAAINGSYCRDLAMAHMLRCLFFLEPRFDLSLSAVHVPGGGGRIGGGHLTQ